MRISDWSSDVCSSDLLTPRPVSCVQTRLCASSGAGTPLGCRRARPFRTPSRPQQPERSEEHTSELQSLMRISYAVFCLKKKNKIQTKTHIITQYLQSTTHYTIKKY